MEEERDFVVFTDDDGNDFELDVIDYFDYKGKEYAVLIDSKENECGEECECGDDECSCEDDECECDCESNVYIMQIVVNEEEDTEEFVSPAEEDMDALIEIVQARFDADEDDCGDDCDCGCEHEHEHDGNACDCGCDKK